MPQATSHLEKPNFPLWATVTAAGSDQWSAAASCATAMLKGLEALQKTQERATREVTERHAAAAERLKNGCSASDIAAVQADLMRADMEAFTRYLQRGAAATAEMQTRMFTSWNRTIDNATMLETLSSLNGKSH